MGQQVKNPSAMQETKEMWFRSLGWEDPLEEGMATPLQDFCLENPMDRGVHGAAKSRTHAHTGFNVSEIS